jgi:rhodanese-related sulfurtransferase
VAFVRLVPLFPFNLLNYVLGLTGIRLSAYILASFVFMAPGALAYTYLGYAGREALLGGEAMIQKVLLALALLAVVLFLPGLVGRLRQGPLLSAQALRDRLAGKLPPVLLDVRSQPEFDGELGHIAGALNIPLDTLSQRLDELSDDLERPIAIVCLTDRRSKRAARILAKRGFGDVQVVEGGMTAWTRQGYPVE